MVCVSRGKRAARVLAAVLAIAGTGCSRSGDDRRDVEPPLVSAADSAAEATRELARLQRELFAVIDRRDGDRLFEMLGEGFAFYDADSLDHRPNLSGAQTAPPTLHRLAALSGAMSGRFTDIASDYDVRLIQPSLAEVIARLDDGRPVQTFWQRGAAGWRAVSMIRGRAVTVTR